MHEKGLTWQKSGKTWYADCWIMKRLLTIFISAWWLTVAFSLAYTRLKYFPEAQISPLPFPWHGVENLICCTGETALAMVMTSHSSLGRQIIELSSVFPNLQRNFFSTPLCSKPPPSPTLPPVKIFCRLRQIIAAKPVSKYAEKVELLTLRLHSPDRYWILWNELELRWALVVFLCQWFLRWRNRAASVTIFQLISFLGKIRCQKKSSSVWTRRSPSDRSWNGM